MRRRRRPTARGTAAELVARCYSPAPPRTRKKAAQEERKEDTHRPSTPLRVYRRSPSRHLFSHRPSSAALRRREEPVPEMPPRIESARFCRRRHTPRKLPCEQQNISSSEDKKQGPLGSRRKDFHPNRREMPATSAEERVASARTKLKATRSALYAKEHKKVEEARKVLSTSRSFAANERRSVNLPLFAPKKIKRLYQRFPKVGPSARAYEERCLAVGRRG